MEGRFDKLSLPTYLPVYLFIIHYLPLPYTAHQRFFFLKLERFSSCQVLLGHPLTLHLPNWIRPFYSSSEGGVLVWSLLLCPRAGRVTFPTQRLSRITKLLCWPKCRGQERGNPFSASLPTQLRTHCLPGAPWVDAALPKGADCVWRGALLLPFSLATRFAPSRPAANRKEMECLILWTFIRIFGNAWGIFGEFFESLSFELETLLKYFWTFSDWGLQTASEVRSDLRLEMNGPNCLYHHVHMDCFDLFWTNEEERKNKERRMEEDY